MVNNQLSDWIKSKETQGYSKKQIKDYLINQGYDSKNIDNEIEGSKKTFLLNSLKYILVSLFFLNILNIIDPSFYIELFPRRIYFPRWSSIDLPTIILYLLPALIFSIISAKKISMLNGTTKNAISSGLLIGFISPLMFFEFQIIFEGYNFNSQELLLIKVIIILSAVFMGVVSWIVRKNNLEKYPEINNLEWLPANEQKHTIPHQIKLNDIFKPTILKCFFPILLFIFILVSFFINSTNMPPVGENMCNVFNNSEELRNLDKKITKESLSKNNQKLIDLRKQEEYIKEESLLSKEKVTNNMYNLFTWNLYITTSMIYKINPFYPTPCEMLFVGLESIDTNYCRYYISEENYNCINYYNDKHRQEFHNNIFSFSNDKLPLYKKASLFNLLTHGIILIVILYIIISLISLTRIELSRLSNKKKIIISGSLIISPIFPLFIYDSIYLVCLLPLIIVFIISSYIKDEKYNKMFLYIITIIILILLIIGIFITKLWL